METKIILDFIESVLHWGDFEETYFAIKQKRFELLNTPTPAPPADEAQNDTLCL